MYVVPGAWGSQWYEPQQAGSSVFLHFNGVFYRVYRGNIIFVKVGDGG